MKNILIFGGGELQLSIIKLAKSLGYKTIVIDPNPNAEAKSLADVFKVMGGQDYEGTLEICNRYNIDGIVTAATDKPLEMMAMIAESKSYVFPSLKSIQNSIDKFVFKDLMLSAGLPIAKGMMIDEHSILGNELQFPLIVKPIDNSGSRGVIKVDTKEQFKTSLEEALSYTIKNKVLIEEFLEGEEISVEALVLNHQLYIVQITDKVTTKPPYNVEIAQLQPSRFIDSHRMQIHSILQSAIDALELDNCAIHPELIINENGIYLIEIGPRLGGDFIASHLVPLSTGVCIEELLLKVALNEYFKIPKSFHSASLIKYLEFPEGKKTNSIGSFDYLYQHPSLELLFIGLKPGDEVKKITNSLNRQGYFIIHGNNIDKLKYLSKEFEQFILSKIIFI